jgi:hypothetical protein
MSVAALIASVGVASAQPPTPAAEQSAPTAKTAPVHAPASKSKAPDAGTKSGQADEMMERKGGRAQRAQDSNSKDMMKSKGMSSETKSHGNMRSEMHDDKKSNDRSSGTKARGKTSSEMKADTKSKADTKGDAKSSVKPGDAKPETTGRGAAGDPTTLSTEQRTTIRTVIKQQNARPMTNVKFSISVGTQVPRTVRYYSVPAELVQIYPSWRGYDYFLVGDQIIVVNPRTHRIVAVLEA